MRSIGFAVVVTIVGCGAQTGLLVPGCDAGPKDDEGVDTTDGGFDPDGAVCSVLDAKSMASAKLFSATMTRTTRRRTDVRIDASFWEPTPSVIEEWTSHPLGIDPGKRVFLAGDIASTR